MYEIKENKATQSGTSLWTILVLVFSLLFWILYTYYQYMYDILYTHDKVNNIIQAI